MSEIDDPMWRQASWPSEGRLTLSIYGSLLFLISAVGGVILAREGRGVLICLAVTVVALCCHPAALPGLWRRRFWLLTFLSLIITGGLALGEKYDLFIGPVAFSSQGFLLGLQMTVRAVTILMTTSVFTRLTSVGDLAALLSGWGMGELGFVLGLAVNLLPVVRRISANTLTAMRLRGGFRRHRLRALRLMLVTILVNVLRYGDEMVCAAEARAFNNTRLRLRPPAMTRNDVLAVVFLLFVVSAVLL